MRQRSQKSDHPWQVDLDAPSQLCMPLSGAMPGAPTPEQHLALLHDCREVAEALPSSGVLDQGGRPYRPIRFERKLDAVQDEPDELLVYVRGMARRTSDGLDAIVKYNRLDLAVETLILDETKIYAGLFTGEDRAAAREKLDRKC
jgi:hypothetical protein